MSLSMEASEEGGVFSKRDFQSRRQIKPYYFGKKILKPLF